MSFENYKYQRFDIEEYRSLGTDFIDALKLGALEFSKIDQLFVRINDFEDVIGSYISLANIHFTKDSSNEFYAKEMDFIDASMPYIQEISTLINEAIINSKYVDDFKNKYGDLYITNIKTSLKTFNKSIIDLLITENQLVTEYSQLRALAVIDFNNEKHNLSSIIKYINSPDRDIRKSASLAISSYYESNQVQYDMLYDKLVKVRDKIAKKLGYDNFINLAYDRFLRVDYNKTDVANFRKQIKEIIVPITKKLYKRQAKRINVDTLMNYDLNYKLSTGNPTPVGSKDELVLEAKKMYRKISKETGEFFDFMVKNNLLDLDSRANKAPGGYCTYLPIWKSPFIFANFNGTSHDIDVLTHEAGHAFNAYLCRDLSPMHRNLTMEVAEIHSMSMEFFAWPYMKQFFKKDYKKYKFYHLESQIEFLTYAALVDEFQEEVFKHPNYTALKRRAVWRKLEKKYTPERNYLEDPFLDTGTYFFRQGHIFEVPFYYIDYALARIISFEFLNMDLEDHEMAWEKYLTFSKLGGSKSFKQALKHVNLSDPFANGSIEKIITPTIKLLKSFKDMKL